jgi:hypothetical protein
MKPVVSSSSYWKLSVAPFKVSLSLYSNSKVLPTVSFTCSSGVVDGTVRVGPDTNSSPDSSCSLYSPLDSISKSLMLQRHSSISTLYAGSNIFLYDAIASSTSQKTSVTVPSSLFSPNFIDDLNQKESFSLFTSINFMGRTHLDDYVAFSYRPHGFDLHASEVVSGIDFEIKGQFSNQDNFVKQVLIQISCSMISFIY